jgi:hypothetical protein
MGKSRIAHYTTAARQFAKIGEFKIDVGMRQAVQAFAYPLRTTIREIGLGFELFEIQRLAPCRLK